MYQNAIILSTFLLTDRKFWKRTQKKIRSGVLNFKGNNLLEVVEEDVGARSWVQARASSGTNVIWHLTGF